ncbi:MAG: hypothetical protein RL226_301, partial [Bacteroidota bacterium]
MSKKVTTLQQISNDSITCNSVQNENCIYFRYCSC